MMKRLALAGILAALLGLPLAAGPVLKVGMSHGAAIRDLARNSNGTLAASASDDGTIKIWEVSSGRELATLSGHTQSVTALAFNQSGSRLHSVSRDNTARVWDVEQGKELRKIGIPKGALSLALSPDDKILALSSFDQVELYDTNSYSLVNSLKGPQYWIRDLVFDATGTWLFSASEDKSVFAWNLPAGTAVKLKGHKAAVNCLLSTPDGKTVLSGGNDNQVVIWDTLQAKASRTFSGLPAPVVGMTWAGKDFQSVLVYLQDGEVGRFDLNEGNVSGYQRLDKDSLGAAVALPSLGSVLVGNRLGEIHLVQMDKTGSVRTFGSLAGGLAGLSISPANKLAWIASNKGFSSAWQYTKGKLIAWFQPGTTSLSCTAIHPDNRVLALGGSDKDISILDATKGKVLASLKGHRSSLMSLAWSRDGRYLVSGGGDGALGLWTADTWESAGFYQTQQVGTNCVAITADGSVIAGGHNAWTITVIPVSDSGQARLFQGHVESVNSLAFSADGKSLFSASTDKTLRLWNLASGKTERVFEGHTGPVMSLALTQNGRLLASGSQDRTIRFWDTQTGKQLALGNGHTGTIRSLAFIDQDSRLLSTSDDGTLRIWSTQGQLLASAVFTNTGEWLTWTDDGYFDGSDTAMRSLLYVVNGTRTYAIDQFFERFHRPDVIQARLKGEDTRKIAPDNLLAGFSSPPDLEVAIRTPQGTVLAVPPTGELPPDSQDSGQLIVVVTARDTGGGVDGIRLFANGKAVGEDQRGLKSTSAGSRLTREFRVSLTAGDNLLSAVGFSTGRSESSPSIFSINYLPPQEIKPTLYVLAAGADTYRNSRYNLNFALADARGFVEAISSSGKKVFGAVKVTEVYEKDLNRQGLTTALENIRQLAKPQDVFIFFYAGHGIAVQENNQNTFWFVLPGVTVMNDTDKLKTQGLSTNELRDLVASIPANKQMLLVDACNSGAFLDGFATRGAAEENALAQLQRSAGIALFSASTDQQFANEVKSLGHGLFTYAVIQGLIGAAANKDGKITVATLKSFIDDEVPLLSQKFYGSEQFPLAKISGQDFPLGFK